MQWSDTAIILSVRKHGENSAILSIFTEGHGLSAGIVRAPHSKANRGIVQPGNFVAVTWQARLAEQLGTLKVELSEAIAAHVMPDAMKLAALTSACALMKSALPEHHPYKNLY